MLGFVYYVFKIVYYMFASVAFCHSLNKKRPLTEARSPYLIMISVIRLVQKYQFVL